MPTMSGVSRRHAQALAALVAASFVVRTAVAWLRAAPALFPDEYTYAALGRSIAESGKPLVRGASPHFPALLQPIVTAPAWLVGDVDTAYRLVQTIGALAMSLAAVPVFLLARRLGLSGRVGARARRARPCSSRTSSSPRSSPPRRWLIRCSSPPSTRRREHSRDRADGASSGSWRFAALATLARVQFAVLPVVYVLAAVAIGLRERRFRRALREQAARLRPLRPRRDSGGRIRPGARARRLPWCVRASRLAARRRPLGRARHDDARLRRRLDRRSRCAAGSLAGARAPPIPRGARVRHARVDPRPRVDRRGRRAPGEHSFHRPDPGALRLLRRPPDRAVLRSVRLARLAASTPPSRTCRRPCARLRPPAAERICGAGHCRRLADPVCGLLAHRPAGQLRRRRRRRRGRRRADVGDHGSRLPASASRDAARPRAGAPRRRRRIGRSRRVRRPEHAAGEGAVPARPIPRGSTARDVGRRRCSRPGAAAGPHRSRSSSGIARSSASSCFPAPAHSTASARRPCTWTRTARSSRPAGA